MASGDTSVAEKRCRLLKNFCSWSQARCMRFLSLTWSNIVELIPLIWSRQSTAKFIVVIEKDGKLNSTNYMKNVLIVTTCDVLKGSSIGWGIQWSVGCDIALIYQTWFSNCREDKFFETIPSILITGRGFPDLATRSPIILKRHIVLMYHLIRITFVPECSSAYWAVFLNFRFLVFAIAIHLASRLWYEDIQDWFIIFFW